MRQTVNNLWHDGSLLRWSTWRSGWRLLLARDGMFRASFGGWRDYFARDFHPGQHDLPRPAAPGCANTRHSTPWSVRPVGA